MMSFSIDFAMNFYSFLQKEGDSGCLKYKYGFYKLYGFTITSLGAHAW